MAKQVNPSKFFLLLIGAFIAFACIAIQFDNKKEKATSKENTEHTNTSKEITICSWNLQNFGKSKKEPQLTFIAETIADYDIVAIQEVVGNAGGEKVIIRLHEKLDSICKTCAWDFEISPLTVRDPYSKERYAYFWKKTRVQKEGRGWLDETYKDSIEREPFFSDFSISNKKFTLANFHAVPTKKQPEREIKFFKYYPEIYSDKHLIFMGDFNLKHTHSVYNPLKKMGYLPSLENSKTTLRMKCINGDCLASYYDNFYYEADYFKVIQSDIVPFHEAFNEDMKAARKISDHLPITITLKIK